MISNLTDYKAYAPSHQAFCQGGVLERPRYFARQLMTPEELILEQDYFRDKLRRHNRLLHGWGVVCGAIVCRTVLPGGNGNARVGGNGLPCPQVKDPSCYAPWGVTVSPGYILGPYGDEIVIDCEIKVDVRVACTTGISGDVCPPAPDPWCADVTVERRPGPVFLAVRYKEIATRPVRVQPYGCGCDDTACEYSRIRDGFELCTLDECPASHQGEPQLSPACELRPCPPCPDEPWVVLARIDLDANGITAIDNYACRRMVISLADLWCRPQDPRQQEKDKDERLRLEQERERRREEAIADIVRHTNVSADELAEGDAVRRLAERSANELNGVQHTSALGKRLEERKVTIADVSAMGREKFVEFAVEGVDPSLRTRLANQAGTVWGHARATMDAVEAWEAANKK
jgi:hypothetical protein